VAAGVVDVVGASVDPHNLPVCPICPIHQQGEQVVQVAKKDVLYVDARIGNVGNLAFARKTGAVCALSQRKSPRDGFV
jgi:hypothetical protein